MTDDEYYEDDDDWVTLPPVSSSARKLVVTFVALLALFGILGATVLVWTARQINPADGQGQNVGEVVVPSGATFDDVAALLEKRGIIGSASVFGLYSRFQNVGPVKAGKYVDFKKNSSMAQAADVLNAGPVAPESIVVTIIPGMWLADALAAINKVFPAFSVETLRQTLDSGQVHSKYRPATATSWEGLLPADTYRFEDDATPQSVLQTLVDAFDESLDELGYDKADTVTGRSAYELVTIASMIERETGTPADERPKIARVIFNRLEQNIALGIDATLLYGLGRKGASQPLTKSELETDGPYNSRTRKGLPPTPIAIPSQKSLAAAISPAEGDWLYYVLVKNDPPEHLFTASYKEFQDAKAACRSDGLC